MNVLGRSPIPPRPGFGRRGAATTALGAGFVVALMLVSSLAAAVGPASSSTSASTPVSAPTPSAAAEPTVPSAAQTAASPAAEPDASSAFPAVDLPSATSSSGADPPACGGPAPSTQTVSSYDPTCAGYDEAAIQFYSGLPGSGGNATWNVTLPVDRNATANQSDLYSAAWFGLVVSDPAGWLGECFVQVLLEPDQSWYAGFPTANRWIGDVVGWQVDGAYGTEDLCFSSPLYLDGTPGPGFLNLTGGDRLSVSMAGWPGNATGETITVSDLTSGNWSSVTLFNATGGFPLDPAYASNGYPDALQWGTSGGFPISFGFTLGHANPAAFPENNSFGGCSPGAPPSTAADPAVPCPSYDPGSWGNDTLHPWEIFPPTFFNATAHEVGAEAEFSDTLDVGGDETPTGLDSLSNDTCAGAAGSAWCSYPWFSYSCTLGAFAFGATDYPSTSVDFGQSGEYSGLITRNTLGFPFYPAEAYSVPGCSAGSSTVTVGVQGGTGGYVLLLSGIYVAPTAVSGVSDGSYAIYANGSAGEYFSGWVTTGAVSAADPEYPVVTVVVAGPGSVEATFSPTPTESAVTFTDSPTSGEVIVTPSALYNSSVTSVTVSSGSTLELPAGVYTVQAAPGYGYNFSSWSGATGLALGATESISTWIVVPASGGSFQVTAGFQSSPSSDPLELIAFNLATRSFGGGEVKFASVVSTSTEATVPAVLVGTYSLDAVPASGFSFQGWRYWASSVLTSASNLTTIALEAGVTNAGTGSSEVIALFLPHAVPVTLQVSGGVDPGQVNVNGVTYSDNSVVDLLPGATYLLSAVPSSGYLFSGWTASPSTAGSLASPASWQSDLVVSDAVTIVAQFSQTATVFSVNFSVSPTPSGAIIFNGVTSQINGTTNSSVATGQYLIEADPASGYRFVGWSTTGFVSVANSGESNTSLSVIESGNVTAEFAELEFPVAVAISGPGSGTITLDDQPVTAGQELWLVAGQYSISVVVTDGDTFVGWGVTGGITVASVGSSETVITVSAPGTLTAELTAFAVTAPSLTPGMLDVGATSALEVVVTPAQQLTLEWFNLPNGCSSQDLASITCTPEHPGHYSIYVAVTDAWGDTVDSVPSTLTVVRLPAIHGLTLAYSTLDVGVLETVTVSEAGGSAPFTYSYTDLPQGCPSQNASEFTCAPTAQGAYNVTVTVSDRFGNTATMTTVLQVNALPLVSVTEGSSEKLPWGGTLAITVAVTGGTGPFSIAYHGLPAGCGTANVTSYSCQPTVAGTFTVSVNVTDAFGKTSSQSFSVTVESKPTKSPTFQPSTLYLEVGLLVLVLVAIAAAVLLARRRQRPGGPGLPKVPAVPARPPPPTKEGPIPEWVEPPPAKEEWKE